MTKNGTYGDLREKAAVALRAYAAELVGKRVEAFEAISGIQVNRLDIDAMINEATIEALPHLSRKGLTPNALTAVNESVRSQILLYGQERLMEEDPIRNPAIALATQYHRNFHAETSQPLGSKIEHELTIAAGALEPAEYKFVMYALNGDSKNGANTDSSVSPVAQQRKDGRLFAKLYDAAIDNGCNELAGFLKEHAKRHGGSFQDRLAKMPLDKVLGR